MKTSKGRAVWVVFYGDIFAPSVHMTEQDAIDQTDELIGEVVAFHELPKTITVRHEVCRSDANPHEWGAGEYPDGDGP